MRRETFAPGQVLVRFAGAPDRLRIESAREWAGWRPRAAGSQTRAEFPGTAVAVEGDERLWEVVAAVATAAGVAYDLAPWPDHAAVRDTRTFSRASCRVEARTASGRRAREREELALALAAPLLGLLPAALQRRLEAARGLPAVRATAASAGLFLLAGGVLWLTGIVARATAAETLAWTVRLLPASAYLVLESAIRLASAAYAREAMGSLPVVLAVAAARAVRRLSRQLPDGGGRLAGRATRPARLAAALPDDEVRELGRGSLEVLSRLPKEHWTPRTLIRFRGGEYELAGSEVRPAAGGGTGDRHRFLLRPAEGGTAFSAAVDYDPAEVRALAREALRRTRLTWALTFALLWGLLDEPLQRRLEEVYGHETELWTGRSALATAALAAAGLANVLLLVAAHRGVLGDLAVAAASLALAAESVHRLLALRAGRIVASVLGHACAPFARRLLRL